jgi:chromosome segregation ATPase
MQVKKSASTHNISNKGSGPVKSQKKDMTQSEIDLMAQNAQMLANHEKEKRELENRISELIQLTETRKSEMEKYKFEIKHLKEQIPSEDMLEELELLRNENKLLKEKLREVGISVEHSTDSEKLSALQNGTLAELDESENSLDHEESAENMLSAGDFSYIDNSNWDKVSQKSGESELSVACLQDRISQMEESHYSTNEELQATLQELTDLQQAVNELSDDNERYNDERSVLMESLCAQTVKLENCRLQIDHLKTLLVTDASRGGPSRSEVERQLVDMLKSVQEERDEVMAKQVKG